MSSFPSNLMPDKLTKQKLDDDNKCPTNFYSDGTVKLVALPVSKVGKTRRDFVMLDRFDSIHYILAVEKTCGTSNHESNITLLPLKRVNIQELLLDIKDWLL